jgi:acetyl-CoA carboxylase biotin carboxylase subunit
MANMLKRVLIANRGEVAARIIRTCRSMGLATVAIYSDPDAGAPFVQGADEAVYIGPPSADASFLAIEKIINAARRTHADAIHPGYGFLSENADFAQACETAGVTFIGPQPDAIRRMGRKIEAKQLMAAAGVPVIPGFSAVGMNTADLLRRIEELGYPVLLKASAGGGGKGMRIVGAAAELEAAVNAARRESLSAFGDDALLVERYFEAPRHIEVQIIGDHNGNLVHCFERECSIQRRHQKVIEEAPSSVVDEKLREEICDAALVAARTIEYRNAGTVEFVLDQQGKFYFLEVNTRLQVEHPVTEEITGLDLVRLQIMIAEGHPLPFSQQDLRMRGHAIEARLYAEDPDIDFLPATGKIEAWQTSDLPGVRYEEGIQRGSEVTIHYDPLLAKVVAHAPTRSEASRLLARALTELRVHGVRTNRDFLVRVLHHPEFLAGRIDTHFINRHGLAQSDQAVLQSTASLHAIAAALSLQNERRSRAKVLREIPSGWRNSPSGMQRVTFAARGRTIEVDYIRRRGGTWDVNVDGAPHAVAMQSSDSESITLVIDGICRTYHVKVRTAACYVDSVLGSSELQRVPRFPTHEAEAVRGGCQAPMPGKVLEVRVTAGSSVRRGDLLIVLEAMKMEHQIVAPSDGEVSEVRVSIGQQVDAGDVLVVLNEQTSSETKETA